MKYFAFLSLSDGTFVCRVIPGTSKQSLIKRLSDMVKSSYFEVDHCIWRIRDDRFYTVASGEINGHRLSITYNV